MVDQTDRAISLVYEASTNPTLWPDALHEIACCTDDVGAILIWSRDDGSFGTVTSPALYAAQEDYQARWARDDLRAQRAVQRSYWLTADVVTDDDCITPVERETHPIYTVFLQEFGLARCAAVGVSPDPTLHAALSVQRAIGRSLYRDDERDLIAKLGRHVERALRLGIELYEAKTTAESLGSALRKAGIAVFTLDRSDLILFKNEEAERVLDGPLRIVDGRLLVRSDGRDLTMTEAFALQGRGSGSGSQAVAPLVLRKPCGGRLILFELPLSIQDVLAEAFLRQSRKIVLVIQQGASEAPDGAVLRDLFGLTSAEARLAACISGGASPREAARTLGITEETARSVLKRIFHKTGTNRQSQLAALLSGIGLRP